MMMLLKYSFDETAMFSVTQNNCISIYAEKKYK